MGSEQADAARLRQLESFRIDVDIALGEYQCGDIDEHEFHSAIAKARRGVETKPSLATAIEAHKPRRET